MSVTEPVASRRLAPLDGLRGIAIVLVMMSHGWIMWPMEFIDTHAWVRPFFRSGNAAVTVFLVVSGFLSFRVLSSGDGLSRMQPVISVARRVVRVGPTLWAMLVVLLAVAALDGTDKATKDVNGSSAWHALTYTYNWLVASDLLRSRSDLGHLWYLSVDMQAFLLFAVVAYLLRRRPLGLAVTLGCWYLVLVWWRFHSFETESIWTSLNRTTTRMDAFILGALAAALMAWLPKQHPAYRALAPATLMAMLPLLLWCDTDAPFMRWGGTTLEIVVAVHVVASASLAADQWQFTGNRALVRLGTMSLGLYIWHYPIFYFIERHVSWAWGWQALAGVAATWLVARTSERLIDRRVTRVLAHPSWAQARSEGLAHYAVGAARRHLRLAGDTHPRVGRIGRRDRVG